MPSTLKENLNSDLIGAYLRLLPKKAAKTVLVYVESYEDIAFWHGILSVYETTDLKFDQEEMLNQLKHYKNKLIDIDKALKSNTEFKTCFLYEKIKADLDSYIGKLK